MYPSFPAFRPFRAPILASLALGLSLAAPASAQVPQWVPLQAGAAPDSPARIVFDDSASTAGDSFFDIWVDGYWTEPVTPGDGFTYERITVPGLGRHGIYGAPDLPQAVLRIAAATSAPVLAVNVSDLDPRTIPGVLPYPFEIPELDGSEDEDGTPAVFVLDGAIYGGSSSWPATPAPPTAALTLRLSTIPSAEVAVSMGRWNPASGLLTLSAHTRVHVQAAGSPMILPPMTRDRTALAKQTFHNWPKQVLAFPTDTQHFSGRYLIVLKENMVPSLDAFVAHKTLQGFDVDLLLLESLPVLQSATIRSAIADWYTSGDSTADHYALLIGDDQFLPLTSSVTAPSMPGDDRYGSPIDGDLDEEIFVGRLSYDGLGEAWELEAMLDRIMAYELDFNGDHYGNALLVANLENAPGKYVGNCAQVASASYDVQPNFTVLNGSSITVSNEDVVNAITSGMGLVTYRGHGSSTAWSSWNLLGESFKTEHIEQESLGSARPVVWSFSCYNGKLPSEDSISESWMEDTGAGPVAHYSSTDVSGTKQNHRLNLHMHDAVFGKGLLRHGHAIAWAEQNMAADEPGLNSWMYMLLGDPSMRVRRGPAIKLQLTLPGSLPAGGSQPWTVVVTGKNGLPAADVLVTVHQAAQGSGPALFANAYTNGAGLAVFFDLPASANSVVRVGAVDTEGNMSVGEIPVSDGTWTHLGGGLAGEAGVPQLLGTGSLQANTPLSLDLTDGRALAAAALFGSVGSSPVPFKGGTLVAFPWSLLLPLSTDILGELHLSAVWPAGMPSDLEFVFQVAMQDPAAPVGVSLSNGLAALTP